MWSSESHLWKSNLFFHQENCVSDSVHQARQQSAFVVELSYQLWGHFASLLSSSSEDWTQDLIHAKQGLSQGSPISNSEDTFTQNHPKQTYYHQIDNEKY